MIDRSERQLVIGAGPGGPAFLDIERMRNDDVRSAPSPVRGMAGVSSVVRLPDFAPVTSPDDPRLTNHAHEQVAGADQIEQMLAMTPSERLQHLVDAVAFERRAHAARRVP